MFIFVTRSDIEKIDSSLYIKFMLINIFLNFKKISVRLLKEKIRF